MPHAQGCTFWATPPVLNTLALFRVLAGFASRLSLTWRLLAAISTNFTCPQHLASYGGGASKWFPLRVRITWAVLERFVRIADLQVEAGLP